MTRATEPPPSAFEGAPPQPGAGHAGLRWAGDGALRRERAPAWGGDEPVGARPPGLAGRLTWRDERQVTVLDGLVLASTARRALGWMVDVGLKPVLFVLVLAVAGIEPPSPDRPTEATALIAWATLTLGFDWICFSAGWSPGMRLLRIRIVRADNGREPGVRRGLVRTLGSVLSQIPIGIGFVGIGHLWAAWHPRRQTWHDMMARTYVVLAPPATPVIERPPR